MLTKDLESLKVVVSDELDRQVGLDSSDFAIRQNLRSIAIRVFTTLPEKNFPVDSVSGRSEWMDTGEALAEKVKSEGYGEWHVNSVSGRHAELWQK